MTMRATTSPSNMPKLLVLYCCFSSRYYYAQAQRSPLVVNPINDGIYIRSVELPPPPPSINNNVGVATEIGEEYGEGSYRGEDDVGSSGDVDGVRRVNSGMKSMKSRERLIMYDFRPAFPPYTQKSVEEQLLLFPKEVPLTIEEEEILVGEQEDNEVVEDEEEEIVAESLDGSGEPVEPIVTHDVNGEIDVVDDENNENDGHGAIVEEEADNNESSNATVEEVEEVEEMEGAPPIEADIMTDDAAKDLADNLEEKSLNSMEEMDTTNELPIEEEPAALDGDDSAITASDVKLSEVVDLTPLEIQPENADSKSDNSTEEETESDREHGIKENEVSEESSLLENEVIEASSADDNHVLLADDDGNDVIHAGIDGQITKGGDPTEESQWIETQSPSSAAEDEQSTTHEHQIQVEGTIQNEIPEVPIQNDETILDQPVHSDSVTESTLSTQVESEEPNEELVLGDQIESEESNEEVVASDDDLTGDHISDTLETGMDQTVSSEDWDGVDPVPAEKEQEITEEESTGDRIISDELDTGMDQTVSSEDGDVVDPVPAEKEQEITEEEEAAKEFDSEFIEDADHKHVETEVTLTTEDLQREEATSLSSDERPTKESRPKQDMTDTTEASTVESGTQPEEKIAVQYDDAKLTSSSTTTTTNNNNNNRDANRQFVTGLDEIDKLFESVEVPDELDVGADGSSMQDVLVGQGLKILWKRFGNFGRGVKSKFDNVVGGVKHIIPLDGLLGGDNDDEEDGEEDVTLDSLLDLNKLKEDGRSLLEKDVEKEEGVTSSKRVDGQSNDKPKKEKKKRDKKDGNNSNKKDDDDDFPLIQSQKAQKIWKFARRKWEQAKLILDDLLHLFEDTDDDDDDFSLESMKKLGKDGGGGASSLLLKGGEGSEMPNFDGKFGSEVDESFLKSRYDAMMKQQEK
eukprot:CAMPEP_0201664034 /NCGR_PEP_ID=MMETSP0494-20130426/5630_1 /ASSEMBLY_ACC=CAM_ASM_000839 /TAXON_ID=420259 /ORGANISM="Thalassiosira gravida, Strain GMp14c1" /LENGTH=919 /DNA_ID=CAMNT_0048142731 /DNA_START=195 /DNA_END=2954 /DNA_ORIENTATION=+